MMGLPTENRSRKGGCVFLAAFKEEHEVFSLSFFLSFFPLWVRGIVGPLTTL